MSLYNKNDPVQILDDGSFVGTKSKIKKSLFKGPGVLKVYAPWCPHCQNKVVCMNALSNMLGEFGMQVYVLDATDNPDFSVSHKIVGFPTFINVNPDGTVGKVMENVFDIKGIVDGLCKAGHGKTCGMEPPSC